MVGIKPVKQSSSFIFEIIVHNLKKMVLIYEIYNKQLFILILMLTLTEKQLGHALFYSIKRDDFDHAEYLLSIDAPVATSYFITQDKIVYTPNLLTGKAAGIIKKYGVSHAKSQQILRILDRFIQKKCDWRCHCVAKNPHYCPISELLKHLCFTDSKDLFIEQNLLLLKLVYNGATFKNLTNSKEYIWMGIQQLNAYISVKKEEAIQLIKMNRHGKACLNRHVKCSHSSKIKIGEI